MHDRHPVSDVDSVPGDQLARVDVLCDRFLKSWRDGGQPRIEDFLPDADDPACDAAFEELLHTEIELSADSRVGMDIDGLCQRFPDKSDLITELCTRSEETLNPFDASTSLPVRLTDKSRDRKAAPAPKQLGRYRIEQTLGQGAMGTVYLARDEKLDRSVALKVPHFDEDSDRQIEQRFEREARIMAAIRHPNLCTIFDVGNIDGLAFLTMEYVDGSTLADRLRDGANFDPRDAATLMSKVARALHLAHEAGVVHRDLKPANILLRAGSDEPVVTDFGLARRVMFEGSSDDSEDSASITEFGRIIGTPSYLSPEQADGETRDIGPTSDVYCLGVLLYELLAGRCPFKGSVARIIASHLSETPDPPSVHREGITPQLDQICLKALAKAPEDRFASAAELADALDVSLAPVAEPPTRRTTPLITAGLIALVAALTLLAFRTEKGTLVVEINDPQIEASTSGVELTIRDRKTGSSYTLGPGPHRLPDGDYTVRVKSDSGLELDTKEFRILDGQDARVVVTAKANGGKPRADVDATDPPIATTGNAPFRPSGHGYDAGRVHGCELADVDADGDLDLVVVNGYEKKLATVWINDGTGHFEVSEQALPMAYQCTLGDVDGDNDPDLWLVRRPEPDLVLLNDGHGTFTDSGQLLGSQMPFGAVLADLDGDDDLDCFLSNGVFRNDYEPPRYNEVLINDGQGMFTNSGQQLGTQFSWSSTACDIDADGDLDICTSNVLREGRTQFWMNDGHGQFEAGHAFSVESMSTITGDMNGDGRLDVVVGSQWSRNRVYLNDKDGAGAFETFHDFGGLKTSEVLVADFDGDDDLDVLATYRLLHTDPQDSARSGIWWNDGQGNLSNPWHWSARFVNDACAADLDGDGDIDVVLGNENGFVIEFNQSGS